MVSMHVETMSHMSDRDKSLDLRTTGMQDAIMAIDLMRIGCFRIRASFFRLYRIFSTINTYRLRLFNTLAIIQLL